MCLPLYNAVASPKYTCPVALLLHLLSEHLDMVGCAYSPVASGIEAVWSSLAKICLLNKQQQQQQKRL